MELPPDRKQYGSMTRSSRNMIDGRATARTQVAGIGKQARSQNKVSHRQNLRQNKYWLKIWAHQLIGMGSPTPETTKQPSKQKAQKAFCAPLPRVTRTKLSAPFVRTDEMLGGKHVWQRRSSDGTRICPCERQTPYPLIIFHTFNHFKLT